MAANSLSEFVYVTVIWPVSVKMLRAARHAVAWMPVCKSVGVSSL